MEIEYLDLRIITYLLQPGIYLQNMRTTQKNREMKVSDNMKLKNNIANNIPILHLMTFFSSLYFYHQITTLYCQARGLNYLQINSLWGIIVASKALAEVPTGLLADKIGRKYAIMLALTFQLVGEILFIFADRYMIFVVVSVIAGIGFAFLSGCFEAMLYDSLQIEGKTDDMQQVSGFNNAVGQLAIIIGSFVGSFIASDLRLDSFLRVIFFTACSVSIALVVSGGLKEPTTPSSQSTPGSWQLLHDGFSLFKTNRSLQRILLLSVLATPFVNYLLTLYQPYFVKANVPGVWFGIALSVASGFGVLTSRYAYMLEKICGVSKGIFLATWLPGLFYLLMAWISSSPWIAIFLFIGSYSSIHLQRPMFTDYMNRHIESRNRATVLSLISMVSGVYVAGMGLIIGALADMSLSFAFLFMGSIILMSSSVIRIHESHVTPAESP